MVPKVRRSRRSCTNSLITMAIVRVRAGERASALEIDHWKLSRDLRHEADEHVLQRRLRDAPVQLGIGRGSRRSPCRARPRRGRRRAGWCRTGPPCRCRARPSSFSRQRLQVGAGHRVGAQMRLRDHLVDRALRQQLAVGDVGDLVAALGLVHVVRGDEHGHAFGGQLVDLVPELAPRLGVDAGGGLVEQQQLGLGQDAGAERQALLPAARQLAGQLLLAPLQPQPLDGVARLAARDRPGRRRGPRTPGSPGSTGPGRG